MHRRRFLQSGLFGLAALSLSRPSSLLAGPAFTPANGQGFDPEKLFCGEQITYHVSFWWFDKAGSVALSFQKLDNDRGYLAQAWGQTHGVIGFFTRYRKDRYRTFMRYRPEYGLLLPDRFEEDVILGKTRERAVRDFHWDEQRITLRKQRASGNIETEYHDMPSPHTVDYLTGYYNLRAGAYGPPDPGSRYLIPTMPNQETEVIEVRFQDEATKARMRKEDEVDWPHYAQITLDPKIVRSETGRVDGWMDADLKPRVGIMRQMLIFGDIRGAWATEDRVAAVSSLAPEPLVKGRLAQPGNGDH